MKIGTVPYKNGHPLTYFLDDETVTALPPSELSEALLNDQLDVALLPVYSIIKNNLRMHPDAGIIGCDGAVESVGLFTRSYIEDLSQIRSIYMDKESLSSVFLTKIILKKFYGISLYDLEFFHHDNREMADAQLLIGDKAMKFKNSGLPYQFWDVGKIWKEHTGAGFMFACWASKRTLDVNEVQLLKDAKDKGLSHIPAIVQQAPPEDRVRLQSYLEDRIHYQVSDPIKEGLKLYKEFLAEYSYSSPLPKPKKVA